MATRETGFADVTSDPISVQHHSATAGRGGALSSCDATIQQTESVAYAPCDERFGALHWYRREPKLLSGRTGVGVVTYRHHSGALGVAPY